MMPAYVTNYYLILVAIGVLAPIVISLVYVFVKKEKITTILAGAATFLVFAIILESIPKVLLTQLKNPASDFLMKNPWALTLVAAFLAGLFEETGRFVVFKYVLKNRNNKTTAVACGLGHGLFEVMYILGISGIQSLAYVSMINAGTFDTMLQQVALVSPEQAAGLAVLPQTLLSLRYSMILLVLLERSAAVIMHIGFSMIVFYAAKNTKKTYCYFVAILLHTLADIFAGMGQFGIANVYVIEAAIVITGALIFAGAYCMVYKKMPAEVVPETKDNVA